MTTVEAVYQGGVFKPTGAVDLPDNQRVRLQVEPVSAAAVEARAWLEEARRFRDRIAARVGVLPDCTPEIAEDRRRDV
jgi:predicted DNA-binding antitoxin AbrB/MazE fold protein